MCDARYAHLFFTNSNRKLPNIYFIWRACLSDSEVFVDIRLCCAACRFSYVMHTPIVTHTHTPQTSVQTQLVKNQYFFALSASKYIRKQRNPCSVREPIDIFDQVAINHPGVTLLSTVTATSWLIK